MVPIIGFNINVLKLLPRSGSMQPRSVFVSLQSSIRKLFPRASTQCKL